MKFEAPCSPGHCLKLLNESMQTDMLKGIHCHYQQCLEEKDQRSPRDILIEGLKLTLAIYSKGEEEVVRNPFNLHPALRFGSSPYSAVNFS
jgi:hypothetical protein